MNKADVAQQKGVLNQTREREFWRESSLDFYSNSGGDCASSPPPIGWSHNLVDDEV